MSSLDTALCQVLLRLDPRHRRFASCVWRTSIESIASGFWLERSSDKSCLISERSEAAAGEGAGPLLA